MLVVETEPDQALSIRKLVLETAKFNVLTAHSTCEAVEMFHTFPNVSAAVLCEGRGIEAEKVARTIRETTTKVPIVYLSANVKDLEGADHAVSSYEPETLVNLLRTLLGDPRNVPTEERRRSSSDVRPLEQRLR